MRAGLVLVAEATFAALAWLLVAVVVAVSLVLVGLACSVVVLAVVSVIPW